MDYVGYKKSDGPDEIQFPDTKSVRTPALPVLQSEWSIT